MAEVIASRDVGDTAVTLLLTDGTRLTVNEADYPCSDDGAEKLYHP